MLATIQTCAGYGVTLEYIATNSGNYLYRQNRPITAKTWTTWIARGLYKAGFSAEKVISIMQSYCNNDWYYNNSFYKPPREIVQREIELSC